MSSEVETSRHVALDCAAGLKAWPRPESFRGCVAASTSLGMTVMRCCDHIEICTGKIRDTVFRLHSVSHPWHIDLAARVPSAIAAALTAILIFAWGRRMGGEKLGWWAAIIFTLSLQTFVHAKAAVADMWLVLFVTLASWAGFELFQSPTLKQGAAVSRPPWAIWKAPFLVFYLALALGFLAKGPIAWTPLLTVAGLIIYKRDWQTLRRFKFAVGLLLMLAVVALWGIPALIQTRGEVFRVGIGRHVLGRSF